jgi:hypothetical protein
MSAQIVVYLIGSLLSALQAAPDVIARWRKLKTIVDEGRDPTPEEWAELNYEIAANALERDKILAAKP